MVVEYVYVIVCEICLFLNDWCVVIQFLIEVGYLCDECR